MIGRVELVTPKQRKDLRAFRKGDGKAYERLGRFRQALLNFKFNFCQVTVTLR